MDRSATMNQGERIQRLATWAWLAPVALAGLAMAGRLAVERTRQDLEGDTRYYVAWGEQIHEYGLLHVYNVDDAASRERWQRHAINYGPAYAYYLWGQDALRRATLGETEYYHPLILLPLLLPQAACYVGVGLLLMHMLRPRFGAGGALLAGGLYWLSPGMLATSAYHGQTDALMILLMLAALHLALRQRWVALGAVLAIGVLVKPQPLLIVPVLAYVMLRRGGWRGTWRAVGAFVVVAAAVTLPFILANDSGASRFAWFTRAYVDSFHIWNSTTNKAYNLWWLDAAMTGVTDPATRLAGIPRSLWGLGLLALVVLEAMSLLRRHRRAEVVMAASAAALVAVAAFLFPVRVWDRYLAYGLVVMIPLAVADGRARALYGIMSLTWLVNLLYSVQLRAHQAGSPVPGVEATGIACAIVLLVCFLMLVWRVTRLANASASGTAGRDRQEAMDAAP